MKTPTQNALTSVIVNTQSVISLPNPEEVKVQREDSVSLPELVHNGQRVITLSMMDSVHRRPEGTARRNFNANKDKLKEGKHYFVRNSSEALELGITAPNGVTLLTESGYLHLVKSFTDDLAWEVQDRLVDGYFKARQDTTATQPTLSPPATLLKSLLDGASILGVPLHLGQSESVKEVRIRMGFDYSPILKLAPAQQNIKHEELMLEPTEIGKRLGMTGVKANLLLEDVGLQEKVNGSWEPTEDGKRFCVQHHWVAGNKSGYNYKWNVAEVLRRMQHVEA